MSEEKFDVIIVGAGLAGSSAAYRLAKAGVKVLLIERGSHAGAKNMTGGRLYTYSLEQLIPEFRETAPLERQVTREKISIMTKNDGTTIDYFAKPVNPEDESYVVLRSKFDKWLCDQAQSAGAMVVNRIKVTELLHDGYEVVGVRCGKDIMRADVVILADGVNSLLAEREGLRASIKPSEMAVGAKEVYTLPKQVINDRLGVTDKEGTAWLCLGEMTHGIMGGGFVYSNENSLSVGMVVGLDKIEEAGATIEEMMNEFTSHPIISPLIKDGKLVERSGHLVPEAGINGVSSLSGNGYLIVGDAAGFCINLGYTVRGMDFAITSGILAADAIIKAKKVGDFSAAALKQYDLLIKESTMYKDLKLYKNFPEFLGQTDRIFQKYPAMVNNIMHDVFTIDGKGAKPLLPKLLHRVSDVGLVNIAKDAMKGVRSL